MSGSSPTPSPPSELRSVSSQSVSSQGVENAWRIHAALADWTGKVDAKAAFAFTVESAALATLTAALSAAPDTALGRLRAGAPASLLAVGASLLALAVLLAALAVVPRMRGRRTRSLSMGDFIYFGHVRHWEPDRLAAALRDTDPLPALSRQLVVMSQVAWRKHRLVQLSFAAAAAGTLCVAPGGLTGS